MPLLERYQIGNVADHPCALAGCKRGRRDSGSTGYTLPFCLEHLTALPARNYRELERLANTSVFDMAGVADAWCALERAKRALTPKRRAGK